jgi:hypothetical protein
MSLRRTVTQYDLDGACAARPTARSMRMTRLVLSGSCSTESERANAHRRLVRADHPAVEKAPAASRFHGVAEEGIPMPAIAEAIGQGLGVPAPGIPSDEAAAHLDSTCGRVATSPDRRGRCDLRGQREQHLAPRPAWAPEELSASCTRRGTGSECIAPGRNGSRADSPPRCCNRGCTPPAPGRIGRRPVQGRTRHRSDSHRSRRAGPPASRPRRARARGWGSRGPKRMGPNRSSRPRGPAWSAAQAGRDSQRARPWQRRRWQASARSSGRAR